MCGALYDLHTNKKEFNTFIIGVADYIRVKVGVKDWQSANQLQLETRDKIHVAIKLFCNVLKNPREAVRLGVEEYTSNLLK